MRLKPRMVPAHIDSYYAATANDRTERPSLQGALACDVCVVGGGYTGLSAALHLAERGYAVVLLEAMRVGWGASGRNGGQLNSGFRLGPRELVAMFGRDDALRLWNLAEEAKSTVRDRIARHAIACDLRDGVFLGAVRPAHLDAIAAEVDCLREVFGYRQATIVDRAELRGIVDTGAYVGGLLDRGGGHLHPLNYALGLARAAELAGARLFEASRVLHIQAGLAGELVFHTEVGQARAAHGVLACDAYLERLVPALAAKFVPITSHMLATEPLSPDAAASLMPAGTAVCDTKFVVDYYRISADRRLLFGGGETYTSRPPGDLKAFVRRPMLRVFPQLAGARIDFAWGGRVAITRNRLPHFGRLQPNLFFAHGYSGQGVALASLAGKLIGEAVAGTAERFDLLARIPHRNFPGGTLLRQPVQVLGMLFFAVRDRL